ncbi:MAG: ABC transporter permease subunit [Acidobacteria bacterium]|nr:ABC transporter permease subunit [Acidobacteriota bacterium]
MSRIPVLAQELRDRRRSLLWWSVGVAGWILVVSAMYPTIRDTSGISELVSQYPKNILALFGVSDMDFSSGAGYLAGELFGFVIPLLVLMLTIGAGASIIGGAEERGLLDLVLSHPVRRRRVLLESAALIVVLALVFGTVVLLSLAVMDPIVALQLSVANLLGTVLGVVLLGITLGWLALVVGALTGSRGRSLAVTGAVAALAYLASSLAQLVDALRPVRLLSPFWYATSGSPLVAGYTWWYAGVLLAMAAAVLTVGVIRFDRRALSA